MTLTLGKTTMIHWYIRSRLLLADLQKKATDAFRHCEESDDSVVKTIAGYMKVDFQNLKDHWHGCYPNDSFGNLKRHIDFAQKQDFRDIFSFDLPEIGSQLSKRLQESLEGAAQQKAGALCFGYTHPGVA